MLQGMELTRTNRSGGLTTYISRADERKARGAGLQPEPLWLEVRREKVKAITLIATFPDACWSRESHDVHDQRAHPSAVLTRWTPCQPGFALRTFFPGGYTGEVTPVPIPNTEVKLSRADGTAGASLWESRTLPGF